MRKSFNPALLRAGQTLVLILIGLAGYFLFTQIAGGVPTAHALPEFTNRTGEPCGTCHVNPGGGGPRTLSGLLWAARGRPDQVPTLPGVLAAPPHINDGLELYDIACAGCHGLRGEGLFAINIAGKGISEAAIRSFVLNGIPELGMPAFENKFTKTQIENLVSFSAQLSSGDLILQDTYELEEGQFSCTFDRAPSTCGEK